MGTLRLGTSTTRSAHTFTRLPRVVESELGQEIPDVEIEILCRRQMFSKQTLAAYLAVTERHLEHLVSSGELVAIKVGGAVRFDVDDVDAYLARRRTQAKT
jgi:excisionase family DNA binding protein